MLRWLFDLPTTGPVSIDGMGLRAGWPIGVLAIAIMLIVAIAILVYRRAPLHAAGKIVLATLRVTAAVLLLFMLLRPVLKVSYSQESPRSVLVLVDRSASMNAQDTRKDQAHLLDAAAALGHVKADDPQASITEPVKIEIAAATRSDLVDAVLKRNPIPGGQPVHTFAFGDRLRPWRPGEPAADVGPQATRLGESIREAVKQHGPGNVAGVVVFTDGASNAGPSTAEAAQWLADHRVPVFPVGIGLTRPDDLSLRGLMVSDVVFTGDLVTLRVQVRGTGYEKRETTLVATFDGVETARKSVTLTGSTQMEELSFKVDRVAGNKALSVSLAPLPGEATTVNNTLTRSVRVSDGKISVLVIEGSPRWEFRYLRAVLKRDPRIDVKFITTEGDPELARGSKEHLARFPEHEAQAYAFDLVILGDVRASVFTPTQLERLELLVRDKGGSLILLAGHKHAPAEYVDTPLAAMLPVWVEAGRWERIGDDVYPVVTAEGRGSQITSLDPKAAKNQSLWANVKPLDRVAPLLGAKPGAKVLAELSDSSQRTAPYPLIAWQRYGAGKTMFIGTDCLWRLRERTGDKYHLRFWGQAVQFMTLSRLLGENKLVRIETDAARGPVGQPVQVFAHVQTPEYEPARQPEYPVQVTRNGGPPATLALKPVPGSAGLYHGVYTPADEGHYTFSGSAEDAEASNTAAFDTEALQTEQLETAMQSGALERLASTTGGRLLGLRDLSQLASLIPATPTVTTVHKEIELWDTTLFLVLFVALTAAEWAWRRKQQLA